MNLTLKEIDEFRKKFEESNYNRLAQRAVLNSFELSDLLSDKIKKKTNVFSHKIDVDVKVSNQRFSGRCWLFSALNVMRIGMIKKYHLNKYFQFSQNYLYFWDQYEKSIYFLINAYKYKNEPLHSQINRHLYENPIGDGGQWNMVINLVNKYGVVPKANMHESLHSNYTDDFQKFIKHKLQVWGNENRKLSKTQFNNKMKKCKYELFKILSIFLGTPPKTFNWEYYIDKDREKEANESQKGGNASKKDKKTKKIKKKKGKKKKGKKKTKKKSKSKKKKSLFKKNKKVYNLTPLEFYKKHVPFKCHEKIALVHFPHPKRPFYKRYNVPLLNNMVNGEHTNYYNVPIEEMIEAAKKSIMKGEPVWMGSDFEKNANNKLGIMDLKINNYDLVFKTDFKIDKGVGLFTRTNQMEHATIIKGFNLNKKKEVTKWSVENSWGKDVGYRGHYVMTNDWFKRHVYEVVVDKKYCSKKVVNMAKKKEITCDPWDPFGNVL